MIKSVTIIPDDYDSRGSATIARSISRMQANYTLKEANDQPNPSTELRHFLLPHLA
eukprot:CAMPEP_0203799088 /NCGR_PEP_ID=MMETSP0100_2-20121128/9710_1 /ASSEMBLY_ACC=CAM_ASM_000210 /TAXON_ID=96639 /ORGANISM=" , Strain NY0313808BC1" /LENGTH=55 /DNA_ID=CAMNT_0050704907 /DNA_START=904 /DNA_END=1071 /DNA_ORIENTATION=+